MHKYRTFAVIGLIFLSGCSLARFGGKSPIEIEQSENPETWKEVYKMQATLWPLEMKVKEIEKIQNKLRDELATTKLSSIQANKNTEVLQAEIMKIKSDPISKEKTAADTISPVEIKKNNEMLKNETTKVAQERKKAPPAIPAILINDIKYYKVSETQERVLIYVNAMNDPRFQRLLGANPRLVLDFFDARNLDKEKYEINTDGNSIKRIRIRSYKEPLQKVRVVFDMMPNKKFSVERKFLKKENIYSFDIRAQ